MSIWHFVGYFAIALGLVFLVAAVFVGKRDKPTYRQSTPPDRWNNSRYRDF